MKMDRRKSSLVFGSRTGKHILRGKNIRKNDDGVHNFEDCWTDSGSESTEESICPSECPQAKQSPSISSAGLATSRQSVRKSKNSYSRTEISDKLDFKRAVDIPGVRNETISTLNKRKKHLKKSKEKGKTLKYLSKDKINNASKIPRVKDKTFPSLDNKKKKHLKEENENIPEMCDSDELELSTGKKKNKKKTAVESDSVPLLRSSRQKFPRLASWRQERLQFRFENGINNFVGIDPGTGEDDGAIKQMLKKIEKQIEAKERKTKEHQRNPGKPKNFELHDVVQNKKVCVPVIKKFHNIPWDKEYRRDDCPYRVKKLFQTVNSACGFIQIEINEEKPLMYMPDDELCLTVMKGKVQATVQDNIFTVGERDMLMIPRCITYSFKNVGLQKALLAFYVVKFQYLESQA